MQNVNYHQNVYLAVSLSPSSPYISTPSNLAILHPSLSHVGQVGQLHDVQLVSVPKAVWESAKSEEVIVGVLKGAEGVQKVDVQVEKERVKRGRVGEGEEL